MKKVILSFMLCLISFTTYAQQVLTIKGTVTDMDDEPLIGASIAVEGTTHGVIADLDGNFSIDVNEGETLLISFIGYQSKSIKASPNTTILNIKLQDGELLDEVVVIGYGVIKKSHLTGSVASVSGKDLQANVARNASSALQGRIAGVTVSTPSGQPGEGMNINIRGVSSLSSTTPLYVIDGVYGDINMVEPSDIQSIEVLKDASASAIYGSRAANGVVLITTKGGAKESPTRISVDAYTGVQTVAKYIDVMDGNELRDFSKQTGYSNAQDLLNWNGGRGTNWQKELYQSALVSKVAVNASGGSTTGTYNVSASYLDQDGIVRNTGYEAWNIRSKNTFSAFNNHLRLGSTIMMKFWKKKYNDVSFTSALTAVPQWSPYDENGNWAQAPSWTRGDNPVGWVEAYDSQKRGADILLNGYAEIDLGLKGLVYKFNVGVNKYTRRGFDYVMPYVFSPTSANPDYKLNEGAEWQNNWMIENTINYTNVFGKHSIAALIGYSAQRDNARSFGAGRIGLPQGLTVIDAGEVNTSTNYGSAWANTLVSAFSRVMYSYDDRYLLSASIRNDGSSKFAKGHRWGSFPSASLGWNVMNEQFFGKMKNIFDEFKLRVSYGILGNLNGIGNYATQSVVTNGLNNVWGNNWQMGGITGAEWVSPTNVTWEKTETTNFGADFALLNGKITFTADYFIQKTVDMLLGMPQPGSFGQSGTPTVNAGTVVNKGLELSINHRNNIGEFYYNAGLNMTFLKNKLTKVNGPRDEWVGFNPHDKGGVTYAKVGYPIGYFNLIETDGIFHSQEEIDNYVNKDGEKIQPYAVPGDIKFVDYNGDGKIDNNDRHNMGSALPKMTLGLNVGAQWKGIDLNMFFDGNFGNKIYNAMYFTTVYNETTSNQYRERLNSWTPERPNSSIPRYVNGVDNNGTDWGYTDRWLESGSFFRLKTLELGYSFAKPLLSKIGLQSLRVYTAMDNLFTITPYKGYTPDLGINSSDGASTSGGDGVMTRGCDDGRYPTARTFTFGVQVNF